MLKSVAQDAEGYRDRIRHWRILLQAAFPFRQCSPGAAKEGVEQVWLSQARH